MNSQRGTVLIRQQDINNVYSYNHKSETISQFISFYSKLTGYFGIGELLHFNRKSL